MNSIYIPIHEEIVVDRMDVSIECYDLNQNRVDGVYFTYHSIAFSC